MKSILLFSGGLDSTVLLYHLLSEQNEVACISFNYGQRHNRELDFASAICGRLGVLHQVVDLRSISNLLQGSALTQADIPVPDGHYTDEAMKQTVVPNRNMIMLAIATAWCISAGSTRIAYAAHAGDHAIYPDCRPAFVTAMNQAIQRCDYASIELYTPFILLTKAEIVTRGIGLDVPFMETWSCYKGGNLHCGNCGTCVERKEAFALSNQPDPTRYELSA